MPRPAFNEIRGATPRQRLTNEILDRATPGARNEMKSHSHPRTKDQIKWQSPRMCNPPEEEPPAEP